MQYRAGIWLVQVPSSRAEHAMSGHVQAWQCIGCGKIEAPQTCIGVCRDVRVELVYASEHEATLAQLSSARKRAQAFGALVRALARITPRAGQWEHSYRALQDQARRILTSSCGENSRPDGRVPSAEQ